MQSNSILDELNILRSRPTSTQADKKNYSEALSRLLAIKVADSLRQYFVGITPDEKGRGQESKARTSKGFKKLDINYSTPELGLGLGVSIKTCNFKDAKQKNYKKNIVRNDNELRAEAHDYHERQPYSVMIAVMFLPADSCDDATKRAASSFAHAVQILRWRSGREKPTDPAFLFERIFIGLYQVEGPSRGAIAFFDVAEAPPRSGQPREHKLLTSSQLIEQIKLTYDLRNNPPFEWEE